jgi:superfamily I DNA/RNA helicase
VLTGRSIANSQLSRDGGKVGSFRLCSAPSGPNDIHLASVHRFKGLESPVVILCEMEEVHLPVARSVWYMGLSRARAALIVLIKDADGTLAGREVNEVLAAVVPPATQHDVNTPESTHH